MACLMQTVLRQSQYLVLLHAVVTADGLNKQPYYAHGPAIHDSLNSSSTTVLGYPVEQFDMVIRVWTGMYCNWSRPTISLQFFASQHSDVYRPRSA